MSYVVSIRRPKSASPFSRSELERAVAKHEGLSLGDAVLVWKSRQSNASLTLNISPRELWTDGLASANSQEATPFLAGLAVSLNAELVGEEGELLFSQSNVASHGSARKTVVGGVFALVSLPFVLLIALVRLPWLLWKLRRGAK